ncbi:MAG: glycosyltransferase family 4 protein [Candidatus Sungbacteria bacterium]|nr:glycosyltransferase family 4 protein [Candidatus Sungbacteria bacterium]
MSRATILYCVTKSVWGGAQRYVYDLAAAMPKEQFSVIVAAGGNGRLFDKLKERNIRTITIASLERDVHFFNELCVLKELFCLYKKEKPDIVHLNSSKIGILGAIAARAASFATGKRIKIIFTAHGWAFNEDRSALQNKSIYCAVRFGSLLQDRVIVINSRDLETAKKFITEKKLALILNGITAPDFFPQTYAREYLGKKAGTIFSEHTLVIGTIAELTKNKGITYLIAASPRLNKSYSFHTVIIGDGEDREALNAEIKKHRMEDKISLAGFLAGAAQYIHGFDIFVLPSLKEGLPYVILEAMHAGVPVVATDIGGISDLIEHKKTGFLVPAKSPGHIASAVRRLAADKKLRGTISTNAKETLKKKFDFSAMIKKTIAVYLK